MAGAFGIGNEVDEQHIAINTIWRRLARSIEPQLNRPPRAQFARGQADDIGMCSGLRNEFKVMQPDLGERQISRNHVRPTF